MLPLTYKDYVDKTRCIFKTKEEIIKQNIEWLIERLYYPDADNGAVIRKDFLKNIGLVELYPEAINWGYLKVNEVKDMGNDVFLIYIHEAHSECPYFSIYLENWMKTWGWNIKVITEW